MSYRSRLSRYRPAALPEIGAVILENGGFTCREMAPSSPAVDSLCVPYMTTQ